MENIERYTKGEEIANAISHGIGVALSIAALVILVVFASLYGSALHVTSFAIYGATLTILYLASTLYHSFPKGKVKDLFEIFDHSSIYLLIAGTYTPIVLITLKGTLGWTIFGIVWGIAIVGIFFKAFFTKRFMILSTLLYLAMGWLIIFAFKPLLAVITKESLIFLVLGGVLYTVGTIFYVWRKMKYHHAVWHVFVLGGSICHFFTMVFLSLK